MARAGAFRQNRLLALLVASPYAGSRRAGTICTVGAASGLCGWRIGMRDGSAMVEAILVSTGEAARRCGLSRHTLLRAVQRGDLTPALRTPGGRLRFHPADIDALAARLAPGPAPVPAVFGAAQARLFE